MSDNGFKAKFSGGGSGGSGTSITLKTNGTNNGSQSILNLANGTNITLADNGSGQVTINNSALANPVLKTANVNNSDQSILNLTAGSGIGIVAGATGLVTINNSATPITLKTNGTNNGSQSILNLTSGSGILISDDGVGGVTIKSSTISNNVLVFSHIAIQSSQGVIPIFTANIPSITYEIEIPSLKDEHLFVLTSRFFSNNISGTATQISIELDGNIWAKGESIDYTNANDLGSINRTWYNYDGITAFGLDKVNDTPTDYQLQNETQTLTNLTYDETIPQLMTFVIEINGTIGVGGFAILDFCKLDIYKIL
jgi:hypothetical protein